MKQCIKCKKTKAHSSFHNNIRMKDGKSQTCKICVNTKAKEYRKEPKGKEKFTIDMRAGTIRKGEYCLMWNILSSLGYDIHKNIHEQFCEKYNLPTKQKPAYRIKWCFDDCFNNEQ